MTRQLVRLYTVVFGLLVVLVAWAVVAAHPWVQASAAPIDPRVRALEAREARLREDALVVQRTVDRRWHAYRVRLDARQKAIVRLRAQHRDEECADDEVERPEHDRRRIVWSDSTAPIPTLARRV